LKLPPDKSKVQERLNELEQYVTVHDMKLNTTKTKIIPFNFSRKYDFVPAIALGGQNLEVVYKTKLLGVICTADCKWNENTKHLVSKANSKVWFLRRLRILGASVETLVDIYKLFVRSHLEFCAPLWSGDLSTKNKRDLERVQKVAMKIILGPRFVSYEDALAVLEEETLEERRIGLCRKFGTKFSSNTHYEHLFPKGITTRTRTTFVEPEFRTKRFGRSAIPHIIRTLNTVE
jgi:hypothetical protein